MTDPAITERLQALQAARSVATPPVAAPAAALARKPKPSGPAPARIVAAAASVAAGIGLVAIMAGVQQDVVVQVNPTPVTVQPASVIIEMPGSADGTDEVKVRVVEAAVPAEQPVPQAKVVSQSEGS